MRPRLPENAQHATTNAGEDPLDAEGIPPMYGEAPEEEGIPLMHGATPEGGSGEGNAEG